MKKTRVCKIAALAITTSIMIIIGIGLGMVYRGEVRLPSIPLSLVGLDVSADKVSYMHADGNGRRWVLEADTAQYHRDSRKALLNQVRVTFYQHDEKVLYLTANNGEIQADNKIITVQGNVVARSAPDTILRTHSLIYQGAMGLVSTTDPVDIETTRMHVKGIGMTMDLNSNQIKIHQSVQSWMMGT